MRPADAADSGDFARSGGPCCDVEHSGDRRSVGRVAVSRQPSADRSPRERCGRDCQGHGIGGIDLLGKVVEEVVVIAQEIRSSCGQRDDVSIGDFVEERQEIRANSVAAKPRIGIGGVLDGLEIKRVAKCMRLEAAKRENRVTWARPHARKARGAGAADQGEQHGLDLIVRGVSEHRNGADHSMAHRSRPSLQIWSVVEICMLDTKFDAEPRRDRPCDCGVVVGRGAKPVMHVDRCDVKAGGHCERSERG